MKDYISLGSVPADEDCVQVGTPEYAKQWKPECERYIKLLKRKFPQYDLFNVKFAVQAFPHDFGTYHEVVIQYVADTDGEEFAYFVEENSPTDWNDDEEKRF